MRRWGSTIDRRASNADVALAQHERLLQSLLHGEALPGPPAERRLIQTHISSLVLAGAFAYKLRKPLRLAFLDFSTAGCAATIAWRNCA